MKIVAPNRVSHSYTQHLAGSAADVFALMCPVREAEWIDDWDPGVVITASGAAEADCVFTTGSGAGAAVWVVTHYDPAAYRIEFVKVVPELTVANIRLQLIPDGPRASRALITYQHTALTPAGDRFVAEFTAAAYERFMRVWEAQVNHYLGTGRVLATATAEQLVAAG